MLKITYDLECLQMPISVIVTYNLLGKPYNKFNGLDNQEELVVGPKRANLPIKLNSKN